MKKFKRSFLMFFLALICAFCLAFGLTACGGDDDVTETPSGTTEDGGDTTTPTTPSTGDDTTTPSTGDDTTTPSTPSGTVTASTVLELLASNLGTEYTITVSDVSIVLPISCGTSSAGYSDSDSSADENTPLFTPSIPSIYYTIDSEITFTAGEMYISVTETNGEITVKAYADGEISFYYPEYDYTYTYSATLYSDGENLYIIAGTNYRDKATYDYTISFSMDYLFSYLSDVEKYDNDNEAAYVSAIYNKIISYIEGGEDETISQIVDLLTNGYSALGDASSQIDNYFTLATTTSGYTLTLDCSGLSDLLDDMYTLTYSEFIDQTCGSGTYASIQSYISGLSDKTVGDVVTEIFTTTAELGLDQDTTFGIIENVLNEVIGEDIDLSEILYGDGTIESQYEILRNISELKIDDFLSKYMDTSLAEISSGLASISDKTCFELLFESAADYAYSIAKTVVDEFVESYGCVITVATDGSMSASVSFNNMDCTINGITYSANGTITIASGAVIPSSAASSTTAKFDNAYSGFIAALSDVVGSDGKYTLADGSYFTVSGTTATYTAGGKTYNLSSSTDIASLQLECDVYDGYAISIIATSDSGMNTLRFYLEPETDDNEQTTYYVYSFYLYEYDANGNMVLDTCSYGDGSTYIYTYEYNADGNRTSCKYESKDSDGNVTNSSERTYTYNSDGTLATEKYESNSGYSYSYTYSYDTTGNLTKAVETSGNYTYTYTYAYDDYGNETYVGYEEAYYGTVQYSWSDTYTYDKYGICLYYASETKEDGVNVSYSYTYTYNSDGDLIEEAEYDGYETYKRTYTYDENGNETYYSYACYSGNTTQSSALEYMWSYTYTYNGNNQLTKDVYYENYENWGYDEYTSTTTYTYDANGNLTERVADYGDGSKYTTTYNSDGYPISTKYEDGDYWYSTTYTRNSSNSIVKEVCESSDGELETITCNDDGYTLTDVYSDGEGYSYSYTYTYNDNNDVTKKVYTVTDNGVTKTYTYTYTYSGITVVKYVAEYVCGSTNGTYTFTYDTRGNKTSETYSDSNGLEYTHTWTYNSLDQVTAENYETTVSGGSYSYTYTYTVVTETWSYTRYAYIVTDASGNTVKTGTSWIYY